MKYNKTLLRKLKNNYITAKALYETIKEKSEKIQEKILKENVFFESLEWSEKINSRTGEAEKKRILKPFDSYLMDDADFQKYINLSYEGFLNAGIADSRGRDYCPEAELNELYREAEKQLVTFALDIIPDFLPEKEILKRNANNIKNREKILDIILKLEC